MTSSPTQNMRLSLGLMTEEEFAALLCKSVASVKRWRRGGSGPKWAKLGNGVFYRVEDIKVWVESSVVK